MRIACAILLALGVAVAPVDVPAQRLPAPGIGNQLQQPAAPPAHDPGAGAHLTVPAHAPVHRSPSDGAGRPGAVSYRYDALGRIIEIVRTPAR